MLNIKIKRIIDKYKDKYLKDLSSSVRNECNSFIINDLILEENSKNNKNIYLYFAHNEHIALDCNSTRKNENYKTEGFFLSKILKIKYLSIATFSQNQYSLWHCNKNRKECKVKNGINFLKNIKNIII